MLIFLNLGKKGNLGNQLFQIASTIGVASQNGHKFAFPKWDYSMYFNYYFPLYNENLKYILINETAYHYSNITLGGANYNLNGWYQSEKYFDKENIKSCFKFQPEIINQVSAKFNEILSKKNILISVRRGDFINNPYYFQLDYKYYFLAITTQFNDWNDRQIIFTSDDINYCKRHFSFLPNAFFIENTPGIEQLALGTLCDDFVISNSTFSWWLAWLGEKQDSKIIRPIKNFRGEFSETNNDKDYFPERWFIFNSKSEKIDLEYWRLIIKGEFFIIIDKIKYYIKFSMKSLKRFIKIIIGRN